MRRWGNVNTVCRCAGIEVGPDPQIVTATMSFLNFDIMKWSLGTWNITSFAEKRSKRVKYRNKYNFN